MTRRYRVVVDVTTTDEHATPAVIRAVFEDVIMEHTPATRVRVGLPRRVVRRRARSQKPRDKRKVLP